MNNLLKSVYLSKKYKTIIAYINEFYPKLAYQETPDGLSSAQYDGKVFLGFPTADDDQKIYGAIKKYLPAGLTEKNYRITRDILTRYVFPHMIPYLKPKSYGQKTLSGFHGQHKDTILDIADIYVREQLTQKFMFRPDAVILNCGAYIGYGDLRVSQFLTDGQIIAVEAKKECFDLLQKNITNNKVKNVMPVNRAVWNKNEQMALNTGDLQANSLIYDKKGSQSIEATTLDSLVQTLKLPKVDHVSLTLNGAEVEAIDGMGEILRKHKPLIRLAGWYHRDGVPIWKLCKDKLEPYGYQVIAGEHGSLYAF